MKLKNIKRGARYETTHGIGNCDRIDAFNKIAYIVIDSPMPFGMRAVKARDILREIVDSTSDDR